MPRLRERKAGVRIVLALVCLAHVATAFRASYGDAADRWSDQVLYQIFVRSFYDSDGDSHGDLKGIQQKLDYLQELGVTGILLTPLYPSPFYHNYFPDSFEGIDAEYGTHEDYLALVREVHTRDMRIIMDMEVQYVTSGHPWYRKSFGDPSSHYGEFILYNDELNRDPEPIFPGFLNLPTYDGSGVEVATLNFESDALRTYMTGLFKYWVDPNGDGVFDDGVDGFRLDHAMDDLDWKGRQTGLFGRFWRPLFDAVREVNPEVLFVGEQATWGPGIEVLTHADADAVFAFPIAFAIRALDGAQVEAALDSTFGSLPPGKQLLVFAENHDMRRLASLHEDQPGALHAAAALTLLLGGVPLLYYGQEIGMKGSKGEWGSDGNDIPMRQAFEWNAVPEGVGSALWYAETGPWWDQRTTAEHDGISVEEQRDDPQSLWNHVRRLIRVRQSVPSLRHGSTVVIPSVRGDVVGLVRATKSDSSLVLVNLRSERRAHSVPDTLQHFVRPLMEGSPCETLPDGHLVLEPFGTAVCGLESDR